MIRSQQFAKRATPGSDAAEGRIAKVINRSFGPLTEYAASDVAREIIARANVEQLVEQMPWNDVIERAGNVVDPMARQVATSIRDEMSQFQGINSVLTFDVIDDLSVRYAQQQSGQLIRNITESQRQAVRQVMRRALQGEHTVESAARALRGTIGLHPAWAQAVRNYEHRQLAQLSRTMPLGKAQELAAKRTQRYHDALVRKRCLNIARTEVHISSGLGRLAAQSEAVQAKLASKNSRREWSAGPGACPICSEMSGETVAWDAPYSNGSQIAHGHPGCRCADVFLPPQYNDVDLDPTPIGWTEPGFSANDGLGGMSRFGIDGLTTGIATSFVSAPPVAATTATHVTTDELDELAATYNQVGLIDEQELVGGSMNEGIVVGSLASHGRVVVKKAESAVDADREYLGGRVLNALGLKQRVVKLDKKTLLSDFADGDNFGDWAMRRKLTPADARAALQELPGAKEIAILDRITHNLDRHMGNFIVAEDRVYPIDHGLLEFDANKLFETATPTTRYFEARAWSDPSWISREELVAHRANLEQLRSEFSAHPEWFDQMMDNLDFWIGSL